MEKDPLEMNNLSGHSDYQKHVSRLRTKLKAWMKDQGDQGVETELKARERQGGNRRNKKNK